MKVLNFGSLNLDYVYRVPHISRPGETLSSTSFEVFAGGKGANQSVALARAGARVAHVGKVGREGAWLAENLAAEGVDTTHLVVEDCKSGHAIIQVDDAGENSIILHPGANRHIETEEIERALDSCEAGDLLLAQNETNRIAEAIGAARERGMRVCLNPAPMGPEVLEYPLDQVDILIVNAIEAQGLAAGESPRESLDALAEKYPGAEIVLTLGEDGVLFHSSVGDIAEPAVRVDAVDTTAAGDTFIGYFLAARLEELPIAECLRLACRAAALCVSRKGASDSIPRRADLQ